MEKQEIFLSDWKRILFGEAPFEFLLEVFGRTCIVYFILLIATRLLGKRMTGELTLTESAVMVTLGAIASPAMQLPDRGIFLAVVALTCTLAFQRGLNLWGFQNPRFEHISQGKSSLVVKDGIMLVSELKALRISKQELFTILRSKGIYNLGKVERTYIEACGIVSVYTREQEEPGLSVIPQGDEGLCEIYQSSRSGEYACTNCGYTTPAQAAPPQCPNCGHDRFSSAVLNTF
ncbi:YetF domain-containing protein [Arcticibacter sp. MXS-1]|uniref:YetF domain-containing protein n=1 Tax=Arcticibacter sp. MXS-1 TaxID=3341726 RepID=UPI0035A923E2